MAGSFVIDRRSWQVTLFILCLATAIVYAPVFSGRVPLPTSLIFDFPLFAPAAPPDLDTHVADIGDLVTQFYPYRALTARAVREKGELPMWNPYMTSGTVFLGNPLSALFYPPNAIYYVLPLAAAWTLSFILRTFLSGLFTVLFLRRIGATTTGALVAALLFMFSGFMTVWQGSSMIDAALWLPLICYSMVRLYDDRSAKSVVIAAMSYAMPALAGHPETAAHLTLTGGVLAGFLALFPPASESPRRNWQFLLCFAGSAVLALGIASVQLVPTLEWFSNVYRGLGIVWPPAPLWTVLSSVSRDIVGETNSFGVRIPNQAAYVGMLAFVAAPLAYVNPSRRIVVFFALWSVIALSVAYGIGPAFEISHYIPFLKTLKNDRLILIGTFGAAVLAGLGISAIEGLKPTNTQQRIRAIVCAGLGFYLACGLIFLVRTMTDAIAEPLRFPKASFLFLLAGGIIVVCRLLGRLNGNGFRIAVLVILGFDVCTFAYGFIPFDKPRNLFPRNPLFDRLASIEEGPFRIAQLGSAFPANVQLIYGLYETGGYEIPLARIKKFGEGIALEGMDSMMFGTAQLLASKDRRADLLNTKYFVVSQWDPLYREFANHTDRFRYRFEYADTTVFENLRSFPAAFLVPSTGITAVADEESQLQLIKDPSFDPGRSVVLSEPLLPLSHGSPGTAGSEEAGVSWVARSINGFQLKVHAHEDSVLVVSQTYYPGWKARIDGRETRLLPADYALTAVAVGPGSHDIRFSYEPFSFKIGLILSVLALAIAGALLIT